MKQSSVTELKNQLDQAMDLQESKAKNSLQTRQIVAALQAVPPTIEDSDSVVSLLSEILATLQRIEAQGARPAQAVPSVSITTSLTQKQARAQKKRDFAIQWYKDNPEHIFTGYKTVRKMIIAETDGEWKVSHTYLATIVKPIRKEVSQNGE